MKDEGGAGWVVDVSGEVPFVRFLRRRDGGIEVAYDVRFPRDAKPFLEVPRERELTSVQKLRHLALQSANKRMVEGRFPLCKVGRSYNAVVLDDPGGKGFLVYLLRPKETHKEVPVGGHYRISIAADGKTVTQVDRLSTSCLTLNQPEKRTEGKLPDYLWVTHLVSNTPVETHVFISLQEGIPLYVGTPDKRIWVTDKGKILFLDTISGNESGKDVPKQQPKELIP